MSKHDDFAWLKKQAKNEKSNSIIDEIKTNKRLVEKENKIIKNRAIIPLRLKKHTIWLRKSEASSVIDMYFEIFKEKHYTVLPKFSGKDDKVVLDIGASEGYYTIKMKGNNRDLKILSVEPDPNAFEILKKNIKSNMLKNVILINKAVASKSGKINFQTIDEVSILGSTKISLKDHPWLDKKRIKNIQVQSTTLSELCADNKITSVDILKLNVEGSEFDILNSSKGFLGNIKKIVLEYHSRELRDRCANLLRKHGFRLLHEIKGKRGDLYFVRK